MSTDYQYRYWVRAKQDTTYSGYSVPAPNHGWMRPMPPADTEGLDLDNDLRIGPYQDYDGDGLSNYEESLEGTNPANPDSDGDGVFDGQDNEPLDPAFSDPRPDTPHFAFVDLGPGSVIDMDDDGDVLIDGSNNTLLWSGGNLTSLPSTDGSINYYWDMASGNGTVLGSYEDIDDYGFASWTGDTVSRISFYDIAAEYVSGNITEVDTNPFQGYWTREGYFLLLVVTTHTHIDYSVDGSPEGGPTGNYTEVGYDNNYFLYLRLNLNGTVTNLGGLYSSVGSDVAEPTAPVNISYDLATDAPGSDHLTRNLSFTYTATPDALIYDTGWAYNSTTLEYDEIQTTYNYTRTAWDSTSTNVTLNGMAIPNRAPYEDDVFMLAPSNLFGGSAHFQGSKSLLVNLEGQARLRNPFADTPALLAEQNGTIRPADFPALPRIGTAAHFETLNTLGFALTGNTDFPLWFGGRSHSKEELGLAADNTSVSFAAMSPSSTAFAGTSSSGNVIVGGSIIIDPCTVDSLDTYYFNASFEPNNIPINAIPNPAVIVMNASDHPATIEADVSNATLSAMGISAGNLVWVLDSDPGNLTGNVAFSGNQDHGKSVEVYGTMAGRVRFTLMYDNGNTTVPLNKISNTTMDAHSLKLEALVANNLNLTCRIQRLIYIDANMTKSPAPDGANLTRSLHIANVFLRQAGITLVLDSNTSTTDHHVSALFGNATMNVTANTTYTGIFDVPAIGPAQNRFYPLGPGDSPYTNIIGGIDTRYASVFLANNYRSNILQIAVLGTDIGDLLAIDDPMGYKGGSLGLTGFADTSNTTALSAYGAYNVNHLSDFHINYIVSINDNDAISATHYLYTNQTALPHNDNDDVLKFISLANATYGTISGNVIIQDLFGFQIYADSIKSHANQSKIYEYGGAIAHETGHVLTLNHRHAHNSTTKSPFDGMGIQPEVSGQQGKYLVGQEGINLMDYSTNGDFTEDLDLAQAIIMRSSKILNP